MKRAVTWAVAFGLVAASAAASTSACAQPRLDVVGVHGGAIVRDADNHETLLGAHLRFGVTERLSLVTAFDLRTDFPGDPTEAWGGTAWWGLATVRISGPQPLGFLAIGAGVAVSRASAESPGRALDLAATTLHEVVVVSVAVPIRRVRPFVDLHLVDAIRTPTAPSSHLTAGLGVSVR